MLGIYWVCRMDRPRGVTDHDRELSLAGGKTRQKLASATPLFSSHVKREALTLVSYLQPRGSSHLRLASSEYRTDSVPSVVRSLLFLHFLTQLIRQNPQVAFLVPLSFNRPPHCDHGRSNINLLSFPFSCIGGPLLFRCDAKLRVIRHTEAC